MGAKKAPTTPTKQQNNNAGVVKKVSAAKQKEIDIKNLKDKEKEKIKLTSADAKKLVSESKVATATSNSNKKTSTKIVVNNVKAITANKDVIKKSLNVTLVDVKKNKSRDNSKDNNEKNNNPKKQQQTTLPAKTTISTAPNNSKVNKNVKEEQEKSNHITKDNKINVKSEDEKLNSNLNCNEENEKDVEISSTNLLSTKSTCDDAVKSKVKLNKKEKSSASTITNLKKGNIKIDEKSNKKNADKTKSKVLKKGILNKEKDNKLKISNELKNLGIEMTTSNSSFDSIQEGLSSDMKTSICEMVKLKKARHCPNSTNSTLQQTKCTIQSTVNNVTDVNGKSQEKIEAKDSQEKVVKNNDLKSKTLEKPTFNVQLKSKENEVKDEFKDENIHTDSSNKSVENKTSKDESKNIETTNKSNNSENMKPVKRKYIKKKKSENEPLNKVVDDQNMESNEPKNSEKSSENKSNLLNLSSTKSIDTEKKSNSESKTEIKDDEALTLEKKNTISDVNESNEKPITKFQKQKSKSIETINVSTPKKIKSQENVTVKVNSVSISRSSEKVSKEIKRKYTKKVHPATKQINQSNSANNSNNQSIKVDSNNKNTENTKSSNNITNSQNVLEKQVTDAPTKVKDKITKENQQSGKNNESKKVDTKKSSDCVNKSTPNKNNKLKVKVEEKKSTVNQKKEKATSLKNKKNEIEEKDPLRISTSEDESSSENSDSDMELSDDIFKKPPKPKIQQANHNKNVKEIEVIKRTRVASLNAIAKVHCLYENEARSHYDSAFIKSTKKPTTIICKVSSEDEDEESDSKETECTQKRSLRTAPGLRAIGKHWEMDSMSSDIDSDSDISQKAVKGTKKSKSVTKTSTLKIHEGKQRHKQNLKSSSKMKNQIRKAFKQSPKTIKASDNLQRDSDKDTERKKQKFSPVSKKPAAAAKKHNGSIKRKKTKDDDKNSEKNVVTKKRMASLNASAILAASYEIENYAAKHDSSTTETSDESDNEDDEEEDENEVIEPPTMKKEKKDVKMESTEETRPKSTTNLVKIDTDVTITGVYVNSALVSSQETICKTLKYRTAYSVTEECVVSRPPTQEPPKSYTPLSALTNMRPPGGQVQTDQCMISPSEQQYQPQIPQQPPQPHMYDPHMGPYQYQYPPPPPSHPMPSTSSAFYPPQPVHRDPMGYYQPAGPLISPHLLPPPPSIEGDQTQQAQSTNGTIGEIVDPDVMITDAHQYHSASCSCPMQSCQSKNVHTGTGPTKAKGPVSASNGITESLPKTSSSHSNGSAQPTISCKVENILSPNVVIKPENDKLNEGTVNQNRAKSHELYDNMMHSHAPSMTYSINSKVLDTPDLSPSPSRGSIGVQQIPTVQHDTAVQPSENNLNSDNAILSHRKQARIGKSMERDRQLQQQQQAVPSGYHNHHHHHHHHHHHINHQQTMINSEASVLVEMQQFKQEYPVKKERDVKKEKDCDKISMTNFNHTSTANIKVERPENENHRQESSSISKSTTNNNRNETPPIVQNEISSENDTMTVNLINESSDECGIDYSIKRKHIYSDDVIVLSDNSTLDPPTVPVKRRKLFEKPISTPKKSPPNSYKSLIKQSNSTPTSSTGNETETVPEITLTPAITTSLLKTPSAVVAKPKLITSNINRILNKSTIKRRNVLKTKSTFKTMRFPVKAKRRALLKKKQLLQQRKKTMTINEKLQQENTSDKLTINDDDDVIENDKNHTKNSCSISETTQLIEDDNDNSSSDMVICEQVSNEPSENNEDKSMDGSSEYSGKSNIDLTIDRVAKGYFSESEIFSSLSKHRKTKSQKRFEAKLLDLCAKEKKKRNIEKVQNNNGSNSSGKDKSLNVPEKDKEKDKEKEKSKKKNTKVNKPTLQQTENATDVVVINSPAQSTTTEAKEIQPNNNKNNNNDTCNKKTSIRKPKKTKAKEPKEIDNKEPIKEKKKKIAPKKKAKEASKNSNEKESLKVNTEETSSSQSTLKKKQKIVTSKKGSTVKKAKTSDVNEKVVIEPSTNENDNNDVNNVETIESKDESSTTTLISSTPTTVKTSTALVIDETDVANNNNECFENNNNKHKQQEPLTLYKTPGFGWTTALVKASRRGKKPKYTNRKKVKLTLPNDIIIPKCTSIPRWSNGWVWEGEPYQALVFLNSDDPPVPRTCYDSMRHEECGDVIKPRDCVLLRAGGKRNELPYVAKVAQLWENPEDGEMMMSLFWYYRPEHTEQGRQITDAIDEVFASRHKDHNSVACIEDKCYVITYNEYCRYRKMLKSVEENIEEPIPLVPKPHADRRLVPPPNTSPELVMFCRRVYDFRGKRLMDDKKKK
ncbi:titin homolog isoform X2 [Chironomus tepperi]|uniref:titin homolog isoform X2 n=1 Tax=Chironomus tepperi TaxID=113505 RepID=UPI00391FBBF0